MVSLMLWWGCTTTPPALSVPTEPADLPEPPAAVCPGGPPVLTCVSPVTTVPEPADPACLSHGDCAPSEFCGAGSCQDADVEVLFCVHQVWFRGEVCPTDPEASTGTSLYNVDAGYIWGVRSDDRCDLVADRCTRLSPRSLGARWTTVDSNHLSSFRFTGLSDALASVNAGCVTLENTGHPLPSDVDAGAIVSVWYP